MDYKALINKIDELTDKYIGILCDLCNIESPTICKSGVDAVGEYIIDIAKGFGWSVTTHKESESGNAICIKMNEEVNEAPVCFSGHMDTVHPLGSFGTPAVKLDDTTVPFSERKIYGPGVLDCKGGIVASLLAMEALQKIGYKKRPVYLILQSDEENGSRFSEKRTVKFMADMAKDAVAFLNTEGHHNCAILERKGIVNYKFEISGVAVHSSLCFEGANAVAEAAHKIIELEKWKDGDGITCNCSVISGGVTHNTVPDKCTFVADIRYLTDDNLKTVKETVEKIANTSYVNGCTCDVKLLSYRTNMVLTEKNIRLLKKMNEIYKAADMPILAYGRRKGGSDAADMTKYGIPTVDSLGVEGAWLHSPKEYALLASLPSSAKRLGVIALGI